MRPLPRSFLCVIAAASLAIGIPLANVLAQSAQPVLAIAPASATNVVEVTVTNGVSGARYELWWVPALGDRSYDWEIVGIGDPDQTNLNVNVGLTPAAFFKVSVGTNYNGIWDYQWANQTDPVLGALAVVIDDPTNTMVLQ